MPLPEIELLDDLLLLLRRHLAFLGHARLAGEGDAAEADGDAGQDDAARRGAEHVGDEDAVEDGRHQGAERGAVAERDRHAERHPQIAHGEPEGEAAESPHHAPEVAPEERGAGRFAEHRGQVAGQEHARASSGAMIQLKKPPTSQ